MTHLTPEEIEVAATAVTLNAHAADCAECRSAVRDAKGRQKLLAAMTPYTLSDMAFRRVEASLMEHAERPPSRWRSILMFAVPAALALVAIGFTMLGTDSAPSIATPLARVSIPVPHGAKFALTAMQTSTDARQKLTGEWHPVHAGEVIARESAMSGSLLALAPAEATWAFRLQGSASLAGEASVTLAAGSLSADITGETADVAAGRLHLISSDSAFFVVRSAAEVIVEVSRGDVLVTDGSSQRRLTAPARMRWSDETLVYAGQGLAMNGFVPATRVTQSWSLVRVSDNDVIASLDGSSVEPGLTSALMSEGSHALSIRRGDSLRTLSITVRSSQPTLVSYDLPEAPERNVEPEALKRLSIELANQTPRLGACYEKWLKTTSPTATTLDLALSITAQGKVKRAHVEGAPKDMPTSVRDCLSLAAQRLVLSPIGVPTDLVVPLNLRARGR